MNWIGVLVFLAGLAAGASLSHGEEFDFDIPGKEEAAVEFSGNLDGKWGILHARENSPFYRTRFYGGANDYLSQYRLDFYLNGDYRQGGLLFALKTFSQYVKDEPVGLSFFELYGALSPSPRWTVGLGKRRYAWGKGYAFNPVGYVNSEKDPENPDLALAGKASAYFSLTRSLSGAVRTVSVSGVVLAPPADVLSQYGSAAHTGLALKLYLLVRDTDLDVMVFRQKGRPQKYGFDFATNLRPDFEVHGEFSYNRNMTGYAVRNGNVEAWKRNGWSYLLGLRYLTQWRTTAILEYYHAPEGLSRNDFRGYLQFLNARLAIDDPDSIGALRTGVMSRFSSRVLMRDYLYIKVSQPEPLGWLYATASLFAIYNVADRSFTVSPQLGYAPFTNFELLVWPSLFIGGENTEYGSKAFRERVEIWTRFYF